MVENPEEKLKALKDDLQSTETELGQLTKEKDTLKADIATLERIVSDVNQVVTAYGQALQNIEKDKKYIEDYSQIKVPMIEAAIQNKKDAINEKIKEVNDQIKTTESKVKELKGKSETANAEYKTAKENRDKNQNGFDSLKTLQKTIDGNLKELKNLKESIEKDEEKNKTANMYFLISELNSLLYETKSSIKTQEEFKSALFQAWQDLDLAETALREKDESMKTAKKEFEDKQNELQSLMKNRRAKILEVISNI